MKKARRQARAF